MSDSPPEELPEPDSSSPPLPGSEDFGAFPLMMAFGGDAGADFGAAGEGAAGAAAGAAGEGAAGAAAGAAGAAAGAAAAELAWAGATAGGFFSSSLRTKSMTT